MRAGVEPPCYLSGSGDIPERWPRRLAPFTVGYEQAMESDKVIVEARELIDHGAGTEQVLRHLRDAGFDQVESLKTLRTLYEMSVREADVAILESETWSDRREETVALRDSFWAATVESADDVTTHPDGTWEATFDLGTRDETEPRSGDIP